jgi:hypothetical protein
MSEWFNVKEIRVREHRAKARPGSRPCLMIVYSLEDHKDAFDFLAFASDKTFAREMAAARWCALRGEERVPETTAEAAKKRGTRSPAAGYDHPGRRLGAGL